MSARPAPLRHAVPRAAALLPACADGALGGCADLSAFNGPGDRHGAPFPAPATLALPRGAAGSRDAAPCNADAAAETAPFRGSPPGRSR
jgi:hypothetical protein